MGRRRRVETSREIQAQLRRREVCSMRVQGMSVQEVADELGMTPAQVRHDVRTEMRQRGAEDVATLVALESDRLDRMTKVAMRQVENEGRLEAIDRVLSISARRAALFGMDAKNRGDDYSIVDQWLEGVASIDDDEIEEPEDLGLEEFDDSGEVPDELE